MNKEFITYEQALALKELGFDEPCIGWYNPQVNYNIGIGLYKYKEVTTDRYWAFHLTGEWENFKPAPLYQQAFRWFREKHGLFGIVDKKDGIRFYKIEDENEKIIAVATSFKTYEEAEQACLDKLIETIKNK
jgi:hypothetical protein